jgi:zinc protease
VKTTRIIKFFNRYWYFIIGVLVVSLAYGLVKAFKRTWANREPELPEVRRIVYDRFIMANGLEVIVHRDASAPTVSVNMSYRVGSRDEPPGKTGLAHLTEHLLLEAGGRQSATSESVVERLGTWDYNGSTDRDRTRLYMTVPKQALDAALWVESERMGFLSYKLTDAAVSAARQDVLNELRRNQSATDTDFEALITEAAFPSGHPYAHLPGGKTEDVEAISLQDVKQWLKDHYTPNNATLVVAGDTDLATVRKSVETYFGVLTGGTRTQELMSSIPQQLGLRHYLTASIPDGTLLYIWTLPGQGALALDQLDLARHVLEARWTQRLVNEDRIATSVRVDFKPYQLCSLLVLKVQLNPQGSEVNVTSSIRQELTDLTTHSAEPSELYEAKRAILVSLLFTSERVGGPVSKAEILASAATLAGNAADFNLTLERIRNASPNDIKAAAAAWLSLDVATVIAHGQPLQQTTSGSNSSRPAEMPAVSTDTQSQIVPERMTLSNRLNILVMRRPGPIGAVKLVWPKEPSLTIVQEQLTKATLNLLSDGGGSTRKADLHREFASLFSQFIIDDTTNYYALGLELPDQYLSQGLEVLSGLVVNARFSEPEVTAIRSRWEQRLKRSEPSSWKAYLSTLQRLAATGQFEQEQRLDCGPLAAINVADIQNTYQSQFAPNHATLIIVGDVEPASLKNMANNLFGVWREASKDQNHAGDALPSASRGKMPIYVIDRPGSDFGVSISGLASPELKAGAVTDTLRLVLVSRVSRTLREETQIAHETFAGQASWNKNGIMYVYAGARTEQIPKALRLIAEVLRPAEDRQVFCETEFERARAISAKRSLQALGSTRSLMDYLTASVIAQGADPGSVSCDDVLNLNRETSGAALVRIVVGDSQRLAQLLPEETVEIIPRPCWSSLY